MLLAAGCGSSGVASVSGRVTLDGKPLAGVHISFQPIATSGQQDPGSGSYAITGADGEYTLRVAVDDQAGAVVGKHRVEIVARNEFSDDTDRQGKPPRLWLNVPARYNRFSELTFEVPPGGAPAANFDLKSN